MKLRIGISLFLLAVLLALVSRSLQIENLEEILFSFPKGEIIILIALSFSISILKAWRFSILLDDSDIKMHFLKNLRAFIASQAMTPLPGGEAIRGLLVKKETGASLLKSSGPVITQAYLEILSALVLTVIGSLFFEILVIPVLIILGCFVLLTILIFNDKLLRLTSKFLSRWQVTKKIYLKVVLIRRGVKNGLVDEKTKLPDMVLIRAFGLSLLGHLLGGLLVFLVARAYFVDLDILKSIFVYSAGIVISSIATISPGGLGFTEGGLTGILLLFGIELPKAISIVIIYRLVTLVFSVVLGLAFMGLFYGRSLVLNK